MATHSSEANVGVLMRDGNGWRDATAGEVGTVQEQKGDCVRAVHSGSADVVMCFVGPYNGPTLCMLYNPVGIASVRDALKGGL